jgi:hypothetical protein
MLKYLEQLRQYLIENGVAAATPDVAQATPAAHAAGPAQGGAQAPDMLDLERRMSSMSVDAMTELQKVNEALLACEAEIDGVKKLVDLKDPSAKNQLAQVEARLNKLEGRNDAVVTAELHEAKEKAKEIRKANLRKLEQLFEVVEELFKILR